MPKFGLGHEAAMYLEVYVDDVKQKYPVYADTDEGWVTIYVMEPVPGRIEAVKPKRDANDRPLTETLWGKVKVIDKRTGKPPK
jgi:hypothetical protein